MNLLPSIASWSSNIADIFTKPLPASTRHQFDSLLGDLLSSTPTTSVATATGALVIIDLVVYSGPETPVV